MYHYFFDRRQALSILAISVGVFYILEQIRIHYSHYIIRIVPTIRYLLRAEEQSRESAGIPYAIGLLLTVACFPKLTSLVAIFALALSDPIAAVIGIRFGRHKWQKRGRGKSIEGSLAFFLSLVGIVFIVHCGLYDYGFFDTLSVAMAVALVGSAFEIAPLKLDDNLSIPLAIAAVHWTATAIAGY